MGKGTIVLLCIVTTCTVKNVGFAMSSGMATDTRKQRLEEGARCDAAGDYFFVGCRPNWIECYYSCNDRKIMAVKDPDGIVCNPDLLDGNTVCCCLGTDTE